ncbi:LOW QUALITY PROTEIN: AP-5 complex subunit mu-1-like [Ara ararauna]
MGLRRAVAVAAARSSRPLPGRGRPSAAAGLPLAWRRRCDGLAGSVAPQCDIEGSAPNITLSLNLPTNGPPFQDTMVHHFVTSIDDVMLMSSSAEPLDDSVYNRPYKFPFILPSDSFSLCYYTSQAPVPPILGFYQLGEEQSQLKIPVNLKLHESIKIFEYCKACTFFNRGPVAQLVFKVCYGQLDLSQEKNLLVCVIAKQNTRVTSSPSQLVQCKQSCVISYRCCFWL